MEFLEEVKEIVKKAEKTKKIDKVKAIGFLIIKNKNDEFVFKNSYSFIDVLKDNVILAITNEFFKGQYNINNLIDDFIENYKKHYVRN